MTNTLVLDRIRYESFLKTPQSLVKLLDNFIVVEGDGTQTQIKKR